MNSHDAGRLIAAVERIADATERQANADPLTMLDAALKEDPGMVAGLQEPQGPYATSGFVVLYRHPDPESGYEIVARRDESAEGGYTVAVERS